MSASIHRLTCDQLVVCQQRSPYCAQDCHQQSDEAADVPLITAEQAMFAFYGPLIFAAVVVAFATGVLLGSTLLHTWDAEIRHALAWAWEAMQSLYWASLYVQG